MSREDEDRQLQDYLDGRLSAEERAELEARLEEDAELAGRVESAREVGQALRAGDEDLSPGFYTRARAHFEESAGGKRRRLFRLLSWETAGLVTAVVLVAAVFLPGLVQREVPGESMLDDMGAAPAPPPTQAPQGTDETAPGPVEMRAAEREPASAIREAPGKKKQEKGGFEVREAEEDRAWAPVPRPRAKEAPAAAGEGAVHEAAPEALRSSAEPEREPAEEAPVGFADPARGDRGAAAPAEARDALDADAEDKLAALGYVRSEAPKRARTLAEDFAGELLVVSGVRVPYALVEAGATEVVRTEAEWRRLRDRLGEERLALIGGYDDDSWLVLIGARAEPFDCSLVHVLATDAAYRVVLPISGAGPLPSGWSCVVRLRRDRPVVAVEPAGGQAR